MILRCKYCKNMTWDEDELIDNIQNAIKESSAQDREIDAGFDCILCEAPVVTFKVHAEECIIEDVE